MKSKFFKNVTIYTQKITVNDDFSFDHLLISTYVSNEVHLVLKNVSKQRNDKFSKKS